MSIATMTSKGQITVPKDVRDELRLAEGSKVFFVRLSHGGYRIVPRTGSVHDWAGMLRDPARAPMTIEEMDEAVAEAVAEADRETLSAQEPA